MDKRARFEVTLAIVTLIMAAMLTALISLLVVRFELSREHSFADAQRSIARSTQLLDEKRRLLSETVVQLSALNTEVTTCQVTQYFVNVEFMLIDIVQRDRSQERLIELSDDAAKCILSYRHKHGEAQGTLQSVIMLFGDQVDSAVADLLNFGGGSPLSIPETPEPSELYARLVDAIEDQTELESMTNERIRSIFSLEIDDYVSEVLESGLTELAGNVTRSMGLELVNDLQRSD